jgi:hypothetical protein
LIWASFDHGRAELRGRDTDLDYSNSFLRRLLVEFDGLDEAALAAI